MTVLFRVALMLFVLAPSFATAQELLSPPHVRVNGEASLAIAPDLARVRAGVATTGKTARDASEANAKAMSAVMAAIKAAGIESKDVQTSRYSVQQIMENGAPGPRISGFTASNAVTITVSDLAGIGALMDRVVAAGANSMGGVEFLVKENRKLLDQVRADALADARRRAQIYAEAAGMRLGNVLSLSESIVGPSPVGPMVMRAASPAETPISAGETTLRVSVNAAFELLKP